VAENPRRIVWERISVMKYIIQRRVLSAVTIFALMFSLFAWTAPAANACVPGDGGGVYLVSSTSSKYTIISGTISGNTATGLGAGIYADGTSEVYPIVINPASGAVITFGTTDVVYLNGNNTRFDLLTSLSSASVPSAIRVQVSNPATDRIVVRTPDNATATASVGSFRRTVPLNYAMAVSGANIIYNGTSLDDE
jgi:hypothetical protein